MDIINQFVEAFEELFKAEDEELEQAKPAIEQRLLHSLSGPAAMESINEYFKQCDLMGYSLDDYKKDIEMGQSVIYDMMESVKEVYRNSQIKCEIVDMTTSALESFYSLVTLQLAGRDNPYIGVELIQDNAKLPTYAHNGDQGADIYCPKTIVIPANARGFMVHTGLKLLIPFGWAIAIRPRSGMSKNTPLRISNSPATIDQQYRGEICILFDNLSDEPYEIKEGERIAQFILEKNYHANYTQVDSVEPDTERGEGGFGSSGN